jgi:hypothetical protein
MVFNAPFNNISVISWRSVLLVEETGISGENEWPATSHRQTWSHNVVSSTPRLSGIRTHNVSHNPNPQYEISTLYLVLVSSLVLVRFSVELYNVFSIVNYLVCQSLTCFFGKVVHMMIYYCCFVCCFLFFVFFFLIYIKYLKLLEWDVVSRSCKYRLEG